MAFMEDYEFVRRLERAGPTGRIEDPPLLPPLASLRARPVAIVWGWALLHLLYWARVSPGRIAWTLLSRARASISNVDELPA
jgi:hypothetical protein